MARRSIALSKRHATYPVPALWRDTALKLDYDKLLKHRGNVQRRAERYIPTMWENSEHMYYCRLYWAMLDWINQRLAYLASRKRPNTATTSHDQ